MTDEERRALFALLGGVARIETKLDALRTSFAAHEKLDEKAYARISRLETKWTKLAAWYGAGCFLVPVLFWLLKGQ